MTTMMTCSVDGCAAPVRSLGLCNRHYQRNRTHGDPHVVANNRGKPIEDRFREKVWTHPDGCWLWTGAKNTKGYALFTGPRNRTVATHRWAYEHFVGPIPEGLQLDHLCRVRHCVNPAHLEPVTGRENQARSPFDPARRTHCPHGHPYDDTNTYRYPDGRRGCRACAAVARARYEAERKSG